MWNFGSLLGLCLIIQIRTGVFLAIHYFSDREVAFSSVSHIIRDVNQGWIVRLAHANGARLFFFSLYLHLGRGIYYHSYKIKDTWIIGVRIFLIVIARAFLGYVLPWGQISFWGATVITNLFSAIPYFGEDIVYWLWGGFAVRAPTLRRFFALHFLLPFLVLGLVVRHLVFLHQTGSSNPLGVTRDIEKVGFHPYFSWKDLLGFVVFIILTVTLNTLLPWVLGDTENFIPANPLSTPIHIQPEWYFLFAYAILRSIPNKLGGVLALLASVVVLYFLPLKNVKIRSRRRVSPTTKIYFWAFIHSVVLLTWIGARPVEAPFLGLGQGLTIFYFLFFIFTLY